MCTIVLAWRVFEDAPIALAANRDESPDRPADPPRRVPGDPAAIMPVDREAGGTWMGVTEDGLLAVVANRWTEGDLAGERSRGLLVRDVLEESSIDGATDRVREALDRDEYEGFALVLATSDRARLLVWDGDLDTHDLDPGLHVLVNVGFDGDHEIPEDRSAAGRRQADAAARLDDRLAPQADEGVAEWLDRAGRALGDHDLGACRHHDRYQTVSSSLLAVDEGDVDWRYADGPPCRTAFRPVDNQV
ncbi:MAG: NRDE family protein [Halanaeroarchaeum sp.]